MGTCICRQCAINSASSSSYVFHMFVTRSIEVSGLSKGYRPELVDTGELWPWQSLIDGEERWSYYCRTGHIVLTVNILYF